VGAIWSTPRLEVLGEREHVCGGCNCERRSIRFKRSKHNPEALGRAVGGMWLGVLVQLWGELERLKGGEDDAVVGQAPPVAVRAVRPTTRLEALGGRRADRYVGLVEGCACVSLRGGVEEGDTCGKCRAPAKEGG
jgi:hypothetical protein